MLGLRGALNAFAPVPTETSQVVQTKAAEMLARYVKPVNGSLLSERKSGGNRVWMEMKGLQLTHVTAKTMSQADQANGTLECYMVTVDCEMYRTYDTAATKWSIWHNGRNPFMPPLIYVERLTSGQWVARLPKYSDLIAQRAIGDPNIIPHGTPPSQKPVITLATAHQPTPAAKTLNPPVTVKSIKTTEKQPGFAIGIVVVVAILVAFGVFLNAIDPKKSPVKHSKPRRSGKTTPPPYNFQAANPQPPSLPHEASSGPDHSLIVGQTHLLTPAERSFLDVLEPIVRPTCAISTKVRLADLFQVKQGRGQQSAFNRISRKHVDFVLTDPATSRILCAVELDDSSHNRPDRIARDQFVDELFANNQMLLIHIPFEWKYNPDAIRDKIVRAGIPLMPAEESSTVASSYSEN